MPKAPAPDIIRNVHRESVITLKLDRCNLHGHVSNGQAVQFDLELLSPDEDTQNKRFTREEFQQLTDAIGKIWKLAEEEAQNQLSLK